MEIDQSKEESIELLNNFSATFVFGRFVLCPVVTLTVYVEDHTTLGITSLLSRIFCTLTLKSDSVFPMNNSPSIDTVVQV